MKNMKIFQRTFLLFVLISFLILLFSSFCFAQQRKLELIYPAVPGVQTPMTTKTALPDYLRYVFTFTIIISGLVAFGAMVYGGILYLTSTGDPAKISDAKDQVTASFLGLIIILSSFLILNTINPQLVLPAKPPLEPATGGIKIYANSNDCGETPTTGKPEDINEFLINQSYPALYATKDSTVILDWGTDGTYKISSIRFLSNPQDLTIEFYSGNDYLGSIKKYDETNYQKNDCQPYAVAQPKSVKLDSHPPGVYLYATENCTGNKYGEDYVIYQSSSATLQEFDNKTQSIKFRYDSKGETKFAAILHEKENYMGEAVLYDQEQGDVNCQSVSDTLSVSSITVYLKPVGEDCQNYLTEAGCKAMSYCYWSAGVCRYVGGVRFWEDKNYTGCALPSKTGFYQEANGTEANLHDIEKCGGDNCDSKDCGDRISAMEMDGHYVALLFRDPDYKGDCEVFTESKPDFRPFRIGQCGWLGRSDCLSSFIIKARK